MSGLFSWLFVLLAALFGFGTTGQQPTHSPAPPTITTLMLPPTVSLARAIQVAGECSNIDTSASVITAAMLPSCGGVPNPGLREGQGIPAVHLDRLEPIGTTAQGFTLGYAEEPVYRCTNACSHWKDHVVVISVPKDALGTPSAAIHISFAVNTVQVDSRETFIEAIKAIRIEA